MKILFSLLPLVVFSSCSSPSPEIKSTPAIKEELPTNWKAQSVAIIKGKARDPDSVRFEEWDTKGGSVSVSVNAKNAFGGYSGFQLWFVDFKNGQAVNAFPLGMGIRRLSDIR